MYFQMAGEITKVLESETGMHANVISTYGSLENLKHLLENRAQMAIMQESAVRSDQVAVVAPLFYEAVHILVRKELEIRNVEAIANKRVMLGSPESGTRQAATRLLSHFAIDVEKLAIVNGDWFEEEMRKQAEVVVAVIKVGQPGMHKMLVDEGFEFLSLTNVGSLALEEPMFRPYEIPPAEYSLDRTTPVQTLATTALLVVRKDAANSLPPPIGNERLGTYTMPTKRQNRWYGLDGQSQSRAKTMEQSNGTRKLISLFVLLFLILILIQTVSDTKQVEKVGTAIGLFEPYGDQGVEAATETTTESDLNEESSTASNDWTYEQLQLRSTLSSQSQMQQVMEFLIASASPKEIAALIEQQYSQVELTSSAAIDEWLANSLEQLGRWEETLGNAANDGADSEVETIRAIEEELQGSSSRLKELPDDAWGRSFRLALDRRFILQMRIMQFEVYRFDFAERLHWSMNETGTSKVKDGLQSIIVCCG